MAVCTDACIYLFTRLAIRNSRVNSRLPSDLHTASSELLVTTVTTAYAYDR